MDRGPRRRFWEPIGYSGADSLPLFLVVLSTTLWCNALGLQTGSLTRFLFRPTDDVVSDLRDLPEQEQVETVRQMLLFSRSTFDVAKEVMPALALDERVDLLELACRDQPRFESQVDFRAAEATFKNRGAPLSGAVVKALKALNVPRELYAAFMRGEAVPCFAPTRSGRETNGFVMLKEDCLTSGIILVHDPGDGLAALSNFRARSLDLARALGKDQLELAGGSVTNEKLGRMLVRQGFELSTVQVPLTYGGGEMEILAKRFEVGSK